jgi:hypothetical protein
MLKFCEDIGNLSGPYPYVNRTPIVTDSRKVSKALRDRLAQPEPEPVAWVVDGEIKVRLDMAGKLYCSETNVYTAPPKREWVGLTDEEREELLETKDWGGSLIAATEAKLKEKNT